MAVWGKKKIMQKIIRIRLGISLFYIVDAFGTDAAKFALLFNRVIRLLTDSELSLFLSRQVLMFLIQCFQSLENNVVRTECLKLVTIGIWTHLAHQGKREELFGDYPNLQKLWNSNNKKMVAASKVWFTHFFVAEKMIN